MSSYGYGYGYTTYGYGYDSYGSGYGYGGPGYSNASPYGHGDYTGYGLGAIHTASYFIATTNRGYSESFSHQVGYRSSTVYAANDVDGVSYGRYSTYNSASGLYHVDTAYGHATAYSGFEYTTYFAHQYNGNTLSEQVATYDYNPKVGYDSYLTELQSKQYTYGDGSSTDITDFFRSDLTQNYGGSSTSIYQSEAQTSTDAYGYSTYSFTSSEHTL